MSDGPTTDRAQRQRAVASGDATDAVEAVSPQSNPGGRSLEGSTRSRLRETRREVASEAGVDRDGVGAIDRLRGSDVFLRSSGVEQFGATVAEQFAGAADFVSEQDVDPNVNAQSISADPVVAPGRRDDVAQRAREQTASDAQFITGADLDVDVGDRGVTGLSVARDRRDDVTARARQGLADDDPFATPDDFAVDVSARGIESAGLSEQGAQRRAGRQFEAETPLREVGSDDLRATADGFALDSDAQARSAARAFEDQYSAFGANELDTGDVRATEGGFALGRDAAREVAAERIDAQLANTTVGPGDVTLTESGDGSFEATFRGES